jgi:hypothetical protein
LPGDLRISPPAAGLDPKLASYSGAWEGRWGGILPSRIIVESITPTQATVVYTWGDSPQFRAGWSRNTATVLSDGTLTWGDQIKLYFSLGDGNSLVGVREQDRFISRVTMTRCQQG